jgi:hypothetical protein
MSIQDVGAIEELPGSIVVFLMLVHSVYVVRQNTQAVRSENSGQIVAARKQSMYAWFTDVEGVQPWLGAQSNPASTSGLEHANYGTFVASDLSLYEQACHAHGARLAHRFRLWVV